MAGGAYKGLTIRIGADVTKLSSSLRGVNSVIQKTQRELRKLSTAARVDPSNTKVMSAQMGALSAQAVNSAQKIGLLKKSIEEMGETKASDGSTMFSELASQTDNAALAASQALDRYNAIDESLANVYDQLKEVTGIDLGEATREGTASYERAVEAMREWAAEADNTEAAMGWLDKSGETIEESIVRVEHMKQAWTDASENLADAKMVESLHNAKVELTALEAQAKSYAKALAENKKTSETAKMFSGVDSQLALLNAAADTASKRFKMLDESAQLDPKNIDKVRARSEALSEQLEVARARSEELKKKLEGYEATGIDKVAESVGNASIELEESKQAYIDAEAEVANLTAQYNAAETAWQRLADSARGDTKSALEVQEASEAVTDLKKSLDDAKEARDQALSRFDTAQAVNEYKNISAEVAQATYEEDKLLVAMRKVNSTEVIPRFDISSAEAMRNTLEHLGDINITDSSLHEFESNLKAVTTASEQAQDRFSRLDSALQLDTNNVDLARARSEALGDAMQLNSEEVQSLKVAMEALPSDKIDQTAIASGKAGVNLATATQAMEEATDRTQGYEDTIKALEGEIDKLASKDFITDDDAQDIANLDAQINALKKSMSTFSNDNEQIVKQFEVATVTDKYQELQTRLSECTGRAKELVQQMDFRSGIELSLGNVNEKLSLVSTGAETARGRFEALDQAFQIRPTSISTAIDRMSAFREALNSSREKAQALKEKIESYKSDGIDKVASYTKNAAIAFEDAKERVADLTQELADAKAEFGEGSDEAKKLGDELERALKDVDTAAAVNEFKELQTELRTTESEAKELKDAMKANFGQIGSGAVEAAQELGQIARDMGQEVVTASRDIDSAYRDLQKTFDSTEAGYQSLYQAAIDYSQTHVTSADSMLEMEAIAAQVGIGLEGGAEAVQHFAEVASNLDVATDIDADDIALKMGQIVNVMDDLNEGNVERFGDALVRLGNTMPAQESAIMQITQRLAAVGSVANFSTPELLGWAAAIAGTGQRSEAAATGISNTITAIQKAVGSGGDALNTFAEVAGMSADEFAAAWSSSPTEALKAFLEGLHGLGDESLQKLEDLDITGVRQTQTLLALAQTTDTVTDAINKANNAWGDEAAGIASSGDAAIEAEKKASGFSGTLSKLENSAQVLAASFGDALVPIMQDVTGAVQSVTKWVQGLDEETMRMGVTVAGAFAGFAIVAPQITALGGALMNFAKGIGGVVTNVIAKVASVGPSLAESLGGPITSMGDFGAAVSLSMEGAGTAISGFVAAAGPAIPIVGALAVAGGVLFEMWRQGAEAAAHSERMGNILGDMKSNSTGISEALESGKRSLEDFGGAAENAHADVDGLLQSMEDYNKSQGDIRESAETSIEQLGQYQSVIEELAGKGHVTDEEMGKLKLAVDGLNEATGSSYNVHQILTGQYVDEAGKVHNVKEEVDKLIASKQEEARVNALSELYTESLKKQIEAEKELHTAEEEYNNKKQEWTQSYIDAAMEQGKSRVEAEQMAESAFDQSHEKLKQNVEDAQQVYDGLKQEADGYASAMGEALQKTVDHADSAANGWNFASQAMGMSIDELKQGLADAGVSSEQMDAVIGEHLAHMAAESAGDIDSMAQKIQEYNALDFQDKHSVFLFDEEGNLVTAYGEHARWDEDAGEWKSVETGIKIDDENLEATKEKIAEMYELDGKPLKTVMEVEGAEKAAEAKEQVDSIPDETTKRLEVEADAGELPSLNEALGLVPPVTNAAVVVDTATVPRAMDNVNSFNKSASQVRGSTKANVSAAGNVATSSAPTTNVKNFTSATNSMRSNRVTAAADGNAVNGAAARVIWDTVNAINHLYNKKVVIEEEHRVTHTSDGKKATGGILPGLQVLDIPKHADGFVATRPVLTNYGWIGEAGAEVYSGGALVPLTNKKYSTPWVNDTSDAVVRKLTSAGFTGGNNINVSIHVDGSGDPEAVAWAVADKLKLVLNAR